MAESRSPSASATVFRPHLLRKAGDDAMLIWSLLSLLAMGCYAYALCVLLLTRQENPLLYTALCGCLAFGLTAMICLKSRHWVLGALHAFVATVAGILLVALLMI